MIRSIVLHRVKDFATWKGFYDGFADVQAENGVVAQSVSQSVEDPNDVLVVHDFEDEATAKAFFSSTELREALAQAGVDGPPQIVWIGTVV